MKINAHIHSLDGEMDEVEILEQISNNEVIALYNGKRCSAVFNPFVEAYYISDIYGVLDQNTVDDEHIDPISFDVDESFDMEP